MPGPREQQVWISDHDYGGRLWPLRRLNTDIRANSSRFPWCQCDSKYLIVHTGFREFDVVYGRYST